MTTDLKERYVSADRALSQLEGQQKLLADQQEQAAARAARHEAARDEYEEARVALEEMERSWRRRFEERLSALVSHGLTAVFGEETRVNIVAETKRSTTHMTLTLTQGGVELGNIVEGTGGSIVSVLSVLLRVMMVVSVRPPLRRLVVLDEPLHGAVDPANIPTFGALLRELADRLDLQLLIVAHETELEEYADCVYLVEKHGDTASVKQIKGAGEKEWS